MDNFLEEVVSMYGVYLIHLKTDLKFNTLDERSTMQVLRSEKVINGDYRPIITLYYDDKIMQSNSLLDDEIRADYLRDKPNLESVMVSVLIEEMERMTKLIGK